MPKSVGQTLADAFENLMFRTGLGVGLILGVTSPFSTTVTVIIGGVVMAVSLIIYFLRVGHTARHSE